MIRFILAVICLCALVVTAGLFADWGKHWGQGKAKEYKAVAAVLFLFVTVASIVALGLN